MTFLGMNLVVVGMLLLVVMLTLENSFVWRTLLLVICCLITWVQTVLIVLSLWKRRYRVLDVQKCSFAVTRVGKLECQDPKYVCHIANIYFEIFLTLWITIIFFRKVALSTYHQFECTIVDFLIASGMSIICFLAYRTITQKPLEFFLQNKEIFKEHDETSGSNKSEVITKKRFYQ